MNLNLKFLIGAVFCLVLIFIIVKVYSSSKKSKKLILQDKGLLLLQKIMNIYDYNEILSESELLKRLEIPNFNDIDQKFKDENKNEKTIFLAIKLALENRNRLNENNLKNLDSDDFNLNLKKNEKLLHVISGVKFYTEKISVYNIVYSGVKFNTRYTRTGSISYIKNEVKNFEIEDSGKIFFTDKRIIFLGDKNISHELIIEKILTIKIYKEQLIIIQPNKKPILLEFFQVSPIFMQDGLCEFLILFDRISSNEIEKEKINVNLNVDEVDFSTTSKDEIEQYLKVKEMLLNLEAKVDNLKDNMSTTYNVLKSRSE